MGWEFDFKYGPRNRVWCRIQSFHPVFWLLLEDQSLSDGVAYVELWRKFGNALERDPRFRKILWRPFKEGPPDWDEVEAADDQPEGTFDKEFPSSKIKAKVSHASIWPYVIGIWLMLSGVATPFVPRHPDLFYRVGYSVSGLFIFMVGAFFFLIAIGQGREDLFGWPRSANGGKARFRDRDMSTITSDPPERPVLEKPPHRAAKPRPKAAGRPLAPLVIGVWFAVAMGVVALVDNSVHGAKAQTNVGTLAVAALLVGLAIVLRAIDARRNRRPGFRRKPGSGP